MTWVPMVRLVFLALALQTLALAACARQPAFGVAHAYVVRGQVVQLPMPGKPGSDFYVSHETIPDFYDAEGQKVGMAAMIMPFPCSDRGKLADLKVGDKIQMTVLVSRDLLQWDISALIKLPAETPLQLAR